MRNRAAIAVAGLAITITFLALVAWRAAVWHERGWTGLRYVSGLPDGFVVPDALRHAIPAGGTIDFVLPGSPAERAGVERGDRIESIDGIRVRDFGAIARRAARMSRGETIVYRIVRNGRVREQRIVAASPLAVPSVLGGVVTGAAMMLAFLSIALLVLWHRPASRAAAVFFWFCVTGAVWSAIMAFFDLEVLSGDGVMAAFARLGVYFLYLVCMLAGSVMSTVMLHLALVFPRELPVVRKRPWLIGWMHGVPLFVALLPLGAIGALLARGTAAKLVVGVLLAAIAILLLPRLRRSTWQERPATVLLIAGTVILAAIDLTVIDATVVKYALIVGGATVLSIFVLLLTAVLYAVATIAALVTGYRRSSVEEKRQLRWPLWGTATALAISLAASAVLFLPALVDGMTTLLIASAARVVYILIPLSFAFAILKHRLMEIDVVIKKTVVYSSVTAVIVAAFFVLVAGVGSYLTALLRIESQTLTVLVTLAVAAAFVPLRNRIQRTFDRRFFQRGYDASEAEKLIQQEIVSATSLESLLPRVAEYVQQALQVRSVVLLTTDESGALRLAAKIGVAREAAGPLDLDVATMSAVEGVTPVSELSLGEAERARLRRLQAELIVPLSLRRRLRGVMVVGSMLSGRFDEDDYRFLDDVAQQIAFAIEKLTITEEMRDYERALEIQHSLLPKTLPHAAGVEIGATWRPARVVGGDYYDVLQLGPSTLGLCIGDVAGKGMPAALLMANLQAAVKASASASILPSEVCTKVAAVVNGTLTGGRFVSFFFATMDTGRMTLRFTNAGHNPPLLLRADGSVTLLSGGGPVFARLMSGAAYATHEEQLYPGDALVLFTDGVTEARRGEEEFGEERLVALAERAQSATGLVASIVDEVHAFCGGAAQDDLTILVVRVPAVVAAHETQAALAIA